MSYSFAKYTDPHRDLIFPEGVAELRSDGRVHALKYDNLGLQQSSKPTFTGPVYILINGGCLSTTAEFLTEVHFHHRATFIREESAGCYYGPTAGDVERGERHYLRGLPQGAQGPLAIPVARNPVFILALSHRNERRADVFPERAATDRFARSAHGRDRVRAD